MIIFFSGGRLGNQIFQYAFIKSILKNNEKIIVSGFEDLIDIFEIEDIINIPRKNRYIRGLVFKIISPLLSLIGSVRLITKIEIDYDDVKGFEYIKPRRESTTYTEKKGLFNFIRFIKTGYFQSESFFRKEVTENFIIKSEYMRAADDFLSDVPVEAHKVFVHLRRGDYKEFRILGKSTLLPISYYKNQIAYLMKNFENCFFILLSDEPEFIEIEFNYLKNKKISLKNDPGTDFAIMTKCTSGILSTSTFGWWASYLIKDRKTIFAPKYWMGFNSKIEFPKGAVPSFAEEVKITT